MVKYAYEAVAPRDAYCQALIALAEKDERILAVDADVMGSMGTRPFAARFPERSINCGIQEANAVCVASALSIEGFIPFFHAFGVFASRRAYDQVFLACGYANANVKIIGGDAGLTAAANGGTHMALEDMALMTAVPGMTVIDAADSVAIAKIAGLIAYGCGNAYLRCCRRAVLGVYGKDASFALGKAKLLRQGTDVTLAACGVEVAQALMASEILENEGISARVVDFFTIKPLDEEMLLACARDTGAVVFCENHNVIGGLGSMGCACLAQRLPTPVALVGVRERYGQVGQTEELLCSYGLDARSIARRAREVMDMKAK